MKDILSPYVALPSNDNTDCSPSKKKGWPECRVAQAAQHGLAVSVGLANGNWALMLPVKHSNSCYTYRSGSTQKLMHAQPTGLRRTRLARSSGLVQRGRQARVSPSPRNGVGLKNCTDGPPHRVPTPLCGSSRPSVILQSRFSKSASTPGTALKSYLVSPAPRSLASRSRQ